MQVVFHVVLLLLCSDILHGEFFPQTTQPQYETGMLQESYYVEMTHKKSNHTEDSQFLKCFICKKVVNSIIKRLKRRIQKKTDEFCFGFVPQFQSTCLSRCKKFGGYLIKEIFPGGGKGTCQLMAIC
ncbi:hypothetical protein HF521_021860 [Silurus meridionalis]|uniref:Saposin B-type domain-containing protein n=1 Tax=Silurus meridionalis TaxID=175797 RepID=A0A8T0BCC2_SILME|nr:hypothetical protein HF521_021860 [Silurus meridionalis]